MVLAIAWFAAVIVTIDCKRCLTFPATRWALKGWQSFACHALLLISLSTSFMSGSYTEPFRLFRKYKVENGDTELLTQIVKKYGGEAVVSQWMRRVFSAYYTISFTFSSAEIAMASSVVQNCVEDQEIHHGDECNTPGVYFFRVEELLVLVVGVVVTFIVRNVNLSSLEEELQLLYLVFHLTCIGEKRLSTH